MDEVRKALKPILLEYLLNQTDADQVIVKILEALAVLGKLRLYEWEDDR